MKAIVLRGLFLLAMSVFGLTALPMPAAAHNQVALTTVQPVEIRPPAADDFSDGDFAAADQPELGDRSGADAGLGLVIFLLLVVLLVLLILWLLENGRLR